ncbi:MAG: PAS domain S-box protein [Acidobacteria bacterium]|nr:PAS domain S-box protein [Acidobacteriota bacterium]
MAQQFAEPELLWQSQVLAQIHDAVVATDLDGQILSWNRAAERLFGYSQAEALGQPIDLLYLPADRVPLDGHMRAAALASGAHDFVGRFRHRSGVTLHAEVRLAVLRNQKGAPIGIVSCSHDVTRRVEQESELRLQSEVLDRMCEAVFLTDREGRVLYANPASGRLFGGTEAALVDSTIQSLLEVSDEDERSALMASIGETLDGGEDWTGDLESRRLNGQVFPCSVSIGKAPIRAEVGWIWVLQDITERKRTEYALREREQTFRSMAEAAPVMVWTLDIEGNFEYVNAAWRRQWGLDAKDARAGYWRSRVAVSDRARVEEVLESATRARGAFHVEFQMIDSSGEERVVLMHGAPLGRGATFRGFVGSSTDITDIRRAEEERRRLDSRVQSAQRLESLGVLAGGIAHDFNNLLVSILGFAELAMDDLPADSPSRTSIQQVEIAARRAAELTQQILTFSGRARANRTSVNLRDLLLEMLQLLEAGLPDKARLRVEVPPEVPAVAADPPQVRQVVMNLLLNAADAVSELGGAVTIRLYPVEIEDEPTRRLGLPLAPRGGKYVCLEVSDGGCGMSEETQRKIFEPFFTTKTTGRGLGLASVLGILRAHKGGIEVASRLGEGSRFRVYLPLDAPQVENAAPVLGLRTDGYPGRGAGILVVDDEPAVLDTLKTMLRRRGYRVRAVSDRAEALRVVEKAPNAFDLIVFDLTMPGMAATEALAKLKQLSPLTPVLLASGYSKESLDERLEGRYGAGFLQKPFKRERLFETFDHILATRPMQPPSGASG